MSEDGHVNHERRIRDLEAQIRRLAEVLRYSMDRETYKAVFGRTEALDTLDKLAG